MRRMLSGRRRTLWFVIADAAALIAFVLIGLRGHRIEATERLLRNAAPLLAAWFVVAWVVHTYRRPGWRTLLRNWIVAVPVGLLVRSLIVGAPTGVRLLVFIGVGLGSTFALLVLGRLLARLASRAV